MSRRRAFAAGSAAYRVSPLGSIILIGAVSSGLPRRLPHKELLAGRPCARGVEARFIATPRRLMYFEKDGRSQINAVKKGRRSSSLSCTSAQRPARPFRRDPLAASRRNAPATSTPCRLYIQPPVRSLGSPRRPPPATQSAPAAAAGAPSSSNAPSPQAPHAPPPSE